MKLNPRILPLQIIHSSLMFGILIFLTIIMMFIKKSEFSENAPQEMYEIYSYVLLMITFMGYAFGYFYTRLALPKIQINENSLNEETFSVFIIQYTTLHIIRAALMEGPALFACVILFLIKTNEGELNFTSTYTQIPLSVIALYFIMMAALFPGEEKLKSLSKKEITDLRT